MCDFSIVLFKSQFQIEKTVRNSGKRMDFVTYR